MLLAADQPEHRQASFGWTGLIARVALASAFILSGIVKLADFAGATAEVRALTGMEPAGLVAAAVIAVQLGGSALLLAGGRLTSAGAVLLGGFTLAASIVAHDFWNADAAMWARQATTFCEHLGLVAGLALATMLAGRD
jgi:uncharacterized membrane protein YphA (DoxX/SURF4 family)